MFRRCISILVIIGLCASQLAVVPHAHAGITAEQQQKHDATPHFHCNWFGHDHHGHDHSHGDRGHKHEHPSKPAKGSTDKPLPDGVASVDHDANAVYVPTPANAVAAGKQQDLPTSSLIWAALCVCQGANPTTDSDEVSPNWRPPDAVMDGSGTYLTLRNLRI